MLPLDLEIALSALVNAIFQYFIDLLKAVFEQLLQVV